MFYAYVREQVLPVFFPRYIKRPSINTLLMAIISSVILILYNTQVQSDTHSKWVVPLSILTFIVLDMNCEAGFLEDFFGVLSILFVIAYLLNVIMILHYEKGGVQVSKVDGLSNPVHQLNLSNQHANNKQVKMVKLGLNVISVTMVIFCSIVLFCFTIAIIRNVCFPI